MKHEDLCSVFILIHSMKLSSLKYKEQFMYISAFSPQPYSLNSDYFCFHNENKSHFMEFFSKHENTEDSWWIILLFISISPKHFDLWFMVFWLLISFIFSLWSEYPLWVQKRRSQTCSAPRFYAVPHHDSASVFMKHVVVFLLNVLLSLCCPLCWMGGAFIR